ncbi:hypothetical protein RCH09_001012 [Actimicrobium sp. GrIS 1.19]|nr:hypothetical protein [Actimicrobium sp. GrIS 1.19]
MRPARLRWLRIALLFLIVGVSGCSLLRISYNNGESLTYWWLDTYVDFEPEQRAMVRGRINELFAWHRETRLPVYARLLTGFERRLQAEAGPVEMAADYLTLKNESIAVIDRALPALAELALSLRPEQIAQVEKKFASNANAYRKEYLLGDIESRQRHRFKQSLKQCEYWFGDFSEEQEAQIRQISDTRPLNNELVLADMLQRQRTLVALLKRIVAEKPERDTVVQWLKEYASLYVVERQGNAEYQRFYDTATQARLAMTAAVLNLTTPKQKAHALKQIRDWQAFFARVTTPSS